MKIKFIYTFVLMMVISVSQAQFGLDKLRKVKNAASEVNKSSKEAAAKNDKSNPDNSPAKESIRSFRDKLSRVEDAIDKGYDDSESGIKDLERLLAKIKTDDPNWVEYEKDEASYKALKSKSETKNAQRNMSKRLEEMRSYASNVLEATRKAVLESYAKALYKTNYDEIKAYYNSHTEHITDWVKSSLNYMDDFYVNGIPKVKQSLLKQSEEYTNLKEFLKENRTKPDYLKNKTPRSLYPEGDLKKIEEGIKFSEGALVFLPGDADLTQLKNTLTERKADLEGYINGPDLKNDIEKRKLMDLDEILITKSVMNDPNMEAIVRRDFDKEKWGTIKRISLLDKGWQIHKNKYGLPLNKYIQVQVGASKDGKCNLISGNLISSYEGGGVYGKAGFYEDNNTEMNCSNMNKNASNK